MALMFRQTFNALDNHSLNMIITFVFFFSFVLMQQASTLPSYTTELILNETFKYSVKTPCGGTILTEDAGVAHIILSVGNLWR
jgi:hypothetical protein